MSADQQVAFPVVGPLLQGAFDQAMQALWGFSTHLLVGAFSFIDQIATPNVDPRTGPIAGVAPTAVWAAGTVAVLLAFLQIGRGAVTRGRGIGRLLVGVGQYALVNAAGYSVLAAMVAGSSGLTQGILVHALGVSSWSGLNSRNSVLTDAAQSYGAVELGMIGLICVIPAALGYLVMALVRDAALLVLAATMPILAAGLLSESTSRWFWKALRWAIALLVLQPATAFVVAVGFNVASAASGGPGASSGQAVAGSTGQSLVTLVIGGLTLLVSLLCPLALFKLLAFIEPGTPSGQAARASVGAVRASQPARVTGRAPAGAGAAETVTASRFATAIARAHPVMTAAVTGARAVHAVGAHTVGLAENVLAAGGVGHHATPRPLVPPPRVPARPSSPAGVPAAAPRPAGPAPMVLAHGRRPRSPVTEPVNTEETTDTARSPR